MLGSCYRRKKTVFSVLRKRTLQGLENSCFHNNGLFHFKFKQKNKCEIHFFGLLFNTF